MANYVKIKNFDVANGEGLGVSVYFAGCDKEPKCKGCFNCGAWSFDAGEPFTKDIMCEILDKISNPHIDHLAILGGEPLAEKNIAAVNNLCYAIKLYYPNKKIWLWTHYTWEELIEESFVHCNIFPNVDVLVDGEYIEEQRDLTLKWRGSKNQRVIDVQESRYKLDPTLYCK